MPRSLRPKFRDKDFKTASECHCSRNPACFAVAKKGGQVAIRNTTDPQKTTIFGTIKEWETLRRALRKGEFR